MTDYEKRTPDDEYIRLVVHRPGDKKSFFESHEYHAKSGRLYLQTAVVPMTDKDLIELRNVLISSFPLTQAELKKLELAQTYEEDGAPETARKLRQSAGVQK